MLIACPRCETTFTLADALYKPGKRARCSNCGLVFPMSAAEEEPAPEPDAAVPSASGQPKTGFLTTCRKPLIAAAAALLLAFLGYGGWLMFGAFRGGPERAVEEVAVQAQDEHLINSISLDEIRQFLVDNPSGKLLVIQGVAVNISSAPKEFVALEARLLDAGGNTLGDPVQQLAGVPLTLFQLQSLSVEELRSTLNNRITILTYNTNIAPGGKVPFVVIFPSPPAEVKRFDVRVIGVQNAAS